MNTIHHRTYILQTLNHGLTNSLIAIVMIYSLSEPCFTLKTILLSTSEDKLSFDAIILVKERSQSFHSTFQTTVVATLK